MENNVLVKPIGKHSVYKFDLIKNYVSEWSQKLLNYKNCSELVFIDCMCNCGEYTYDGNKIYGTPVRIAKLLRDVSFNYPNKKITLYFNDNDENKINYLMGLLPPNTENFSIHLSVEDGNEMINKLGKELSKKMNVHYLLVYDPFEATINWNAIKPFLNRWGEVIINHMVSDPIRAIKMVKSQGAKEKYEQTYLCDIEELIPFGSDKNAYERRISEILANLRTTNRDYYVASFPFFNRKNALEYNLIHCTGNIEGFKLFKKVAWQVFGGHSSNKNLSGNDIQSVFDFENFGIKYSEDENCYSLNNIIDYIHEYYKNREKVSLDELWSLLNRHPVFPSDGFKTEIKRKLKKEYGIKESRSYLIFTREEDKK